MAYAAVTCLYHTIHHLLHSCRISVDPSTREILKSAKRRVKSLQETLRLSDRIKSSSQGVMEADARIRDEAHKLQDAIESQASAQFLEMEHGNIATLSLNRQDIDCFVQTTDTMGKTYTRELYDSSSTYDEAAAAAAAVSSTSDVDCDNMVGLSDQFLKIRDHIVRDGYPNGCPISLAITGMVGIGKTTFVKKLLNDPLVKEKFECRAFVRVGQEFQFEQLKRAILAQLNVVDGGDSEENLDEHFNKCFKGRKFLIVLDDVWDTSFECHLTRLLPADCHGCVLPTSRIQETSRDQRYSTLCYQIRFMNEDEGWELLRRKVFGELQDCPSLLVKAGKKIVEKCEGLPLLIVTVAKLLIKDPKTPEYWEEVAEMKNSVFEDAMDQIYEQLLGSYHYMDQNAKPCFLYMGVFPRNYVVRRSRIDNLWRAERFAMFGNDASFILDYLVDSNLVVIRNLRSRGKEKAKDCNLHVVYRHLSKREGENNKFLHILNTYAADGSIEDRIRDKRRLAICHNTLLAMKEVHNSIERLSNLRSVLCTGPYHQYQVPICLELRLLRVLDAVSIRFYEFPEEVVKLIQLRYLSLTTNANLPPSIKKLWFLQFLIVHQHLSIINRASVVEPSSYVPVEIWDLKELEHLQIIGRNLPHPPSGTTLPNLTKLLDVGVQTCAIGVIDNIPKLEKLRIQIELAPDAHAAQMIMSDFDHLACLEKLTSVVSVVKNPKLLPKPTLPPRLLSISIGSIEKLSLSGFGYPWEDMSNIAELPRLKVLKLQCYAFRGEKWDAREMRFSKLHYLLIEDSDVVKWTGLDEAFPRLQYISMKNCHKLRNISFLQSLRKIKLVDCNPLVETWADRTCRGDVEVKYSWK